jgi:hypothetical protein
MSPRELPSWFATSIWPVAKSKLLWRFCDSFVAEVYS